MKTIICLLDNHPIPAITPLIDKDFISDKAVFVYAPQHHATAERVAKLVASWGIKTQLWELPKSTDVEAHKLAFLNLVEEFAQEDISLNASCGQRYVNLAAYEVFRLYDKPIFCVEPTSDTINWVYPDGQAVQEISDSIKIRHYLQAYGATQISGMKHPGIPTEVFEVCQEWAKNGKSYQYAISALNYLAATAKNDDLISEALNSKQLHDPILNRLIDSLETIDYCQWQGKAVKFSDEDARFFANGGWLENYVFAVVRKLQAKHKKIQDNGISIEVEREHKHGKVKNELDVGVLANNRLHLIECKTKKFLPGEGNSVIYKIDSLVDLLGGVEAKGLIVSYLPLAKYEKVRAQDLGIEVIDYQAITHLESRLTTWILS